MADVLELQTKLQNGEVHLPKECLVTGISSLVKNIPFQVVLMWPTCSKNDFQRSCEMYVSISESILLLVKSPLPHKTLKNNAVFHFQWGRTDEIALFKAFLHNCGRAGISSKQFKKTKQNNRISPTFPKSQKNTWSNLMFKLKYDLKKSIRN